MAEMMTTVLPCKIGDTVWAVRGDITDSTEMIAVQSIIDDAPAVDAVDVVRCRDCKYYDCGKYPLDMKSCCRLKDRNGEVVKYYYPEDGFCSYGERRVDDER